MYLGGGFDSAKNASMFLFEIDSKFKHHGAVGFIDWLDVQRFYY